MPLYARRGTGRKHGALAMVGGGGGASGSDAGGSGGTSERRWKPTEGRWSTGENDRMVISGMNVSVLSMGRVWRIEQ